MVRVLECLLVLQFAALVWSYSDDDDEGRIIGGQDAKIGEFPYQVSLRYGIGNRTHEHDCGGSIIADEWILTAAHCIMGEKPENVIVVTGTNSLSQGGDTYNVEKFVTHKKWSHHDIGLIKLSNKIKMNHLVQKIHLAKKDTPADLEAVLSGWGTVTFPKEALPDKLQKIKLKTVSNKKCVESFKKEKEFNMQIYPGDICAFSKIGKGACHGDSGGPLVVAAEQVGIVSRGKPCAKGKPDVFTSVYKYLDWIQEHMK